MLIVATFFISSSFYLSEKEFPGSFVCPTSESNKNVILQVLWQLVIKQREWMTELSTQYESA